ncbi:hypothetical protein PH586_03685 [Pseudomonas sp. SA3-5]|uniref:Uncharacterized protein n=1 Tax=Pseudomonas aestuarii TaxID=3018340 RepID=A0ABT4XB10_9PSED|nr:hypothetical protein [Pseudomonas aestuarii]MDA7085493.1 hypothetical protein [Pseudomonas aestuarii]
MALERRGSINNIGNGIGGGLSMGEDGDSQLALGRFERANQERAKMIASQREAEGGGRLTVIRDSSRAPSIAELQNGRMDERTAQADALRNRSAIDQQRLGLDSRELDRNLANDQINRQKTQQELRAGQLALDSDVRTNTLRTKLADPTLQGDERAQAERNFLLTADPASYLANQAKSGTYRLDMETKQLEQQVLRQKLEQGQQKAEQTQQDRAKAAEGVAATFELAIGSADRLIEHPGLDRAVGISSIAPSLPGGNAANFEAQLDTLKAQTFLPQVQALKGAGALSDAEGKKLSEAVGALSTRMSPEAFKGELKRVRNSLAQAQERALRGIPAASQGGQAPTTAAPTQIKTDDEYAALPPGAVFTDPNGVTRRKP